eukprot:gene16538-18214_t
MSLDGVGAIVVDMAETELPGRATSKVLSANEASCSIDTLSADDAKINCAWVGRRRKNNWRRILSSKRLSPRSCRIRRNNCEGFLSPSSSEINN